MIIGWPQGILLVIVIAGMGITLSRLGEPKPDKYDIIDLLIAPAITFGLLYWGGFFTGGCS